MGEVQPHPVQSGGAPALRPSAIAHSPGREAALAWASLAQRFPASSVLAREKRGHTGRRPRKGEGQEVGRGTTQVLQRRWGQNRGHTGRRPRKGSGKESTGQWRR